MGLWPKWASFFLDLHFVIEIALCRSLSLYRQFWTLTLDLFGPFSPESPELGQRIGLIL